MADTRQEIQDFIKNIQAQIQKTIAEGEALVQEAELRIAETDRMLESQGLTREQVLAMNFTDEQIAAANAELERRGLGKIDYNDFRQTYDEPIGEDMESAHDLKTRAGKLRRLMRPIRI